MADAFKNHGAAVWAPARAPYNVVPHATDPLPTVPKALYIGTGGHVTLRGVDGTADVTYKNVPSGSTLDVQAGWVRDTTTAQDIVAQA